MFNAVVVEFRVPPVTLSKIAVLAPVEPAFSAFGDPVIVDHVQSVIVAVVRTKLISVVCDVAPVVRRY